ncbi:hypothetical protein Taro_038812, partial [Colocasia esculenta]|nr:hypothetical protein [Colocasia esculenta]
SSEGLHPIGSGRRGGEKHRNRVVVFPRVAPVGSNWGWDGADEIRWSGVIGVVVVLGEKGKDSAWNSRRILAMAAMQKLGVAGPNAGGGFATAKVEEGVPEFPAGLRVLVVDDDTTCLKILEQMLRKCDYSVTICSRATNALSLLRERKGCFDLVISDVHMPDMDGFKLLELVGLEMDLPVIMMSADVRTSTVMQGIKHGACDYLIKPVRFEELKNIWQHVVRKKWNENKDHEQSGSLDDSDRHKRAADDGEYASSVNDAADGNWKTQKKKRDSKEDEDDGELENDDPSTSKKPRVVWSVELHQQFVSAVNQLGIDKAVPKRILELMNVPGLTRENVASHLQKFRLYLKRLSVAQHQGGLANSLCGSVETNAKVGPLGRLDFQSLAASGQIPPQTLAALHAELLGRPSSGMVLPALEQPVLLQQGPKCIPVEHEVTFGKPLMKCPSIVSKHFPQSNITVEDMSSGYGTWVPNHLPAVGTASIGGLSNPQNSNMLVQMLQQQQQPPQPVLSESSQAMNVQPSCLVTPSQPSTSFQIGNDPISMNQNPLLIRSQSLKSFQVGNNIINQNSSYMNTSAVADHMLLSSRPINVSLGIGQVVDGDLKNAATLNGYPMQGSISSAVSSCSVRSDGSTGWRAANSALSKTSANRLSGFMPNVCDIQSPVSITTELPAERQGRNLGFVGKGTSIPSRFAVDDIEFPTHDLCQNKANILDDVNRVEQDVHLDFLEDSKLGNPMLPHFSPNDIMSVLSK